jgi:cation diffusion facilitator CzcD-associated flavoprotein CzcO
MLEVGLVPTVFEKSANVGGYWSPEDPSSKGPHLHPELRLNSSLSCNAFSDWYPYAEDECPGYVRAKVAGEYLASYAKNFLPDRILRLSCSVTLISPEGKGDSCSWRVDSENKDGHKQSEVFDFLIIATGSFSESYIPYRESLKNYDGRALHSSQYVGEDIFPENESLWSKPKTFLEKPISRAPDKSTRVLVVGGYVSGVEIAAELALRVSSLPEERRSQIKIMHVFPKPFWIVPRMLPLESPTTPERPRWVDFLTRTELFCC